MDFKQRIIDELKLTPIQADTILKDYIEVCEKLAKEYHALQLQQTGVINWVACNYVTGEGMPDKYGRYLICRKDGKIHWETYNGSGWAYNGNVIKYWAVIQPPCL